MRQRTTNPEALKTPEARPYFLETAGNQRYKYAEKKKQMKLNS